MGFERNALAAVLVVVLSGAALAQTGGGSGGSGGGAGAGAGGASGGATSGAGAAGGAAPTGAVPGTGTGGPSLGAGTTTTNSPTTGGVPASPGALNNQTQSNQNQQVGTGARNSGAAMQPSTQPGATPGISGSPRDAGARANAAARCEQVLAKRAEHNAQEIAACERSSAGSDPAGELDKRLQRDNSRAVNSICRGC